MNTPRVRLIIAASALFIGACGSDAGSNSEATTADTSAAAATDPATDPATVPADSTTPPGAPASAQAAVEISDFTFVPAEVRVTVGGVVTWTNNDAQKHTATANGGFDAGSIGADASAEVTFDTAGTYDYICSFHPFMKGTVVVE